MGDTLERDPYDSSYLPDEDEVGEATGGGYGGGGYGPVIAQSGAGAPAPTPSPAGAGGAAQGPVFPHTPRSAAMADQIRQMRGAMREARQGGAQTTPGEIYTPPTLYPEQEPEHGWWHDAVRKVWASTQEMGQEVLGVTAQVQEAIGASPEAKAWVGDRRKELEESIQGSLKSMSPARQRAAGASLFGGTDPATGEHYPSPGEVGWGNYITDRILGFIPQAAFLALPGGTAGRIAQGLLFGTLGSGAAFNTIADQIGKMTPEQLKENPLSREVLNSGGTVDDARKALVHMQATSWQALGHALTGAATGVGLGGLPGRAGRVFATAPGRGRLANAGVGAAEAGGVLGGASGSTEALTQSQQMDLGTRRELDPSAIARQAAGGAVGGVVLGGSLGLLKRPLPPKPDVKPEVEGVPADVQQALQGELDLTTAPPGTNAWSNQGELFRGIQDANARPMGPPPPGTEPPPYYGPGPTPGPTPTGAPQGELNLQQPVPPAPPPAPPGFIPGAPQGEMFPGQEMGGQPPPPPPGAGGIPSSHPPIGVDVTQAGQPPGETVPGISNQPNVTQAGQNTGKLPGEPATVTPAQKQAGSSGPPPSQGMKVRELRDALRTMPGQDPKVINVAPIGDLRRRYDQAMAGAETQQAPPLTPAPTAPITKPTEAITPKSETTTELPKAPSPIAEAEKAPLSPPSEAITPTQAQAPPPAPPPAKPLTKAQQLIADAKAKRAAQKAKLTGTPVERTEHAAYTERANEAEAAVQEEARETQRAAMTQRLSAALGNARRAITPLAKGQDVTPIVHRMMRDLSERIGKTNASEGAVAEQIAGYVRDNPGKIPGTTTSYHEVGDRLLRMMTGEGLPAREGFMRGAREEASGQPTKFEEAATREGGSDITTVVKEAAAGAEGVDKPHAPTTDHEKIAYRLLDEVLGGTKTAAEAHNAYGQPSKGGRPRRADIADFPTFLQREITRAEDPALREAIIEALKKTQEDIGERGTTKGNTTKAEEAMLARTGKEYADRLRELHREIADPVGHAADKQAGPSASRVDEEGLQGRRDLWAAVDWRREVLAQFRQELREPDVSPSRSAKLERMIGRLERELGAAENAARRFGVDPEGDFPSRSAAEPSQSQGERAVRPDGMPDPQRSRYVRVRADPRLNQHIHDIVARGGEHGATLHEILHAIVNHVATKEELRPLHELARLLLERAPNLTVLREETARAKGWTVEADNLSGTYAYGYYAPRGWRRGVPEHIGLNVHPQGSAVETLLHEAMHSVTRGYLDHLAKNEPWHEDLAFLEALRDELYAQVNTAIDKGILTDRMLYDRLKYAMSNPNELHTILYTDPRAQAFAASVPASEHFRNLSAGLGFPTRPGGTSVWRYFTDWIYKALGAKRPASQSEFTLLDSMLRPLQDITDRAHAHNVARDRALFADKPEAYRDAAPSLDAVTRSLDPAREKIAEKLSNVPDRLRRFVMPAMPYDRLFDQWGKKLFQQSADVNLMENHRTAIERAAYRGKQFTDKYSDDAMDLVALLKKNPRVADLMDSAGYAKAALGTADPEANAHLTTQAERARLAELQAEFAKLSKPDQELYQKTNKIYNDMHGEERTAQLHGLIDQFLPDITEAQKDAIRKSLTSRKAFDKFISDPDNSLISKAFEGDPRGWKNYRDTIRGIANVHSQGYVQGDYFRMARLGDYFVVYGEPRTDNYGVEAFESRHEAEARRQELLALKVPDVHDVELRAQGQGRSSLPASTFDDQLLAAAKNNPAFKGSVDELRTMLDQIRLRTATYSEASRVRARRRGIAGASKDAARVLGQTVDATAKRIGHLEHGLAISRARDAMSAHASYLARTTEGDAYTAQQLVAELAKRDQISDSAQHGLSSLARSASSFGYVQSLMSLSRIAVEAVEHSLMAGAFLGARHGYGRVALEQARAIKNIGPRLVGEGAHNMLRGAKGELRQSNWNLAHLAQERLLKAGYSQREVEPFFKHFIEAGTFDMTYSRALQIMAKPGGGAIVHGAWQRFLDLSGAMGHSTEETAKIAMAWTAYRLELARPNSSIRQSIRYADDMVRKLPNWNPGMKPRISTDKGIFGKFSAPIMQFKLYGLNAYSVLGNLAHESLRGATPEAKREAMKSLAGVLAAHASMAGVLTWIADPVRYIGGAWDLMTGSAPHDRQPAMRAFLSDTFGPEIAEVMARGLPHLAGIDLHNRLGMTNMLNIPELDSFDKKGMIKFVGSVAMGAAGEDAATMAGGFNKALHGDVVGGMIDAFPRIIRDPVKAAKLYTKGVTDPTGKQILAPEKVTGYDVGAQALGFQPSRVSEVREKRNAILQARTEWTRGHADLENRWVNAEPEDRAAIMSEIRQWNSEHPGMPVTMSQLLQARVARMKQARGPGGLRLPPKAAPALAQYGRFAP